MSAQIRIRAGWLIGVVLASGLTLLGVVSGSAGPRPKLTYEKSVLPLFRQRCLACHSGERPMAGLTLTTRGDLLEGGHGGRPVMPGQPEQSLLYRQLASGAMPQGGEKLSARELKLVADWIRAGAPGKDEGGHWAFKRPVRPQLPKVRDEASIRNAVDRFVLAKLERRGLDFAPEADRRTLIRRVTYDLIGLPPTPEGVIAFLEDQRPDAYERLVDRLLADSRFGERWARHWLDIAGYADSEGVLQEDRLRPNAWRYRDYVIRAFNSDKPYDQFLREQLAGDEMVDWRNATEFTPEMIDTLAATGFLRTAVDATRPDFNKRQYGEYQHRMWWDTQQIVVTATMALSVQCARCHNHKLEPFSQRDYYAMQALFAGAIRPRGKLLPTMNRKIIAASAAEQQRAKEVNATVDKALAALKLEDAARLREYQLKSLEANLAKAAEADREPLLAAASTAPGKRSAEQKALVAKYKALAQPGAPALAAAYPEFKERQAEVQRRRSAEQAKRITLPAIRALYDQDANPPPTPLLARGEWLKPGEPVPPGILAVLDDRSHPFVASKAASEHSTGRRTAFAEWLTRPDHPLTARVIVNRLWAHHFGEGIVSSTANFGRSGARPTHPRLLDWLATELVRGGEDGAPWTLKRLHRLMVTSRTYRQASRRREEAAKADPENRLLWRQRQRRLEAEAIRDGMLSAAGTLDGKLFGPATGQTRKPSGEIVSDGEEASGRRSIYLLVRRSQPVTFLNVFDAPVMETNCTGRTASTTATQALALLNSAFVSAQAKHFASRVVRDLGGSPQNYRVVHRAYELAFGRPAKPVETVETLEFVRGQSKLYQAEGKPRSEADLAAYADLCQALLSSNEFVYVD